MTSTNQSTARKRIASFHYKDGIVWLAYLSTGGGKVDALYAEGWDMEGNRGGKLYSLFREILDAQFCGGFSAKFIDCDRSNGVYHGRASAVKREIEYLSDYAQLTGIITAQEYKEISQWVEKWSIYPGRFDWGVDWSCMKAARLACYGKCFLWQICKRGRLMVSLYGMRRAWIYQHVSARLQRTYSGVRTS